MPSSVAPGQVEEKTIRTRILPAEETEPHRGRKWPPVWDFLPTVTPEQWKNGAVVISLYRYDPVTEKRCALEKFTECIDEFAVKRRFGGGKFNMLVNVNPPISPEASLRYNEEFYIEGEPITPKPDADSHARIGGNGADANAVTLEALRMMSNPEVMRLQMELIRNASIQAMEIMKSQIPAAQNPLQTLRDAKEILGVGTPAPDPFREMFMPLMIKMFERALVPGDPLESVKTVGALVEAMKTFTGQNVKTDVMSTLVSNLPALMDRGVSVVREYRLAQEAQVRGLEIQRGITPSSTQPITVEAHEVQPNPTPQPAPGGDRVFSEEDLTAVELLKLERLINHPESTGEDVYDLLRINTPQWIEQLRGMTRDAILTTVFPMNPILKRCLANPRLPQLIDEFLVIAKEEAAPPPVPTKTN